LSSRRRRLLAGFVTLVAALLLVVSVSSAAAAPTDLFFSEYIEGTSNNKALEIFNGTGAPVDLTAQGYKVQMFFNGSGTAGLTINLTGSLANGDVSVLAQHGERDHPCPGRSDERRGLVQRRRRGRPAQRDGGARRHRAVGSDPGTE